MEEQQKQEEYRGYAPEMAPQISDSSFLAAQTNPAELLKEIEHHLRGEQLDLSTGNWKKVREQLANDSGIGTILLKIRSLVTQNTILSNLSERNIGTFMKATCKAVRLLIAQNYQRFEIKESDLSLSHNIIVDPTYFALMRSLNQGERNFLRGTLQQRETVMVQQPKKRSLLDGIFKPAQ